MSTLIPVIFGECAPLFSVALPSGYASYLDTSVDVGGISHAAWNENGILFHASWDPEAGRWGDAAQIANATDASNIQLTPGTVRGSAQPVLLATWESGDRNNADLFLSVGLYETDNSVVWSDVVPFRTNGVADRNHKVGTARDGIFVITNEVRNDPLNQLQQGSRYNDSDLATTIVSITPVSNSPDETAQTVIYKIRDKQTIQTINSNEKLLRVLANGQWYTPVKGASEPILLEKLGSLQYQSGGEITFTPDPDFTGGSGSVEFIFEKLSAENYLTRTSAEVFAQDAVSDTSGRSNYRITLQEAGGVKPYENKPVSFSQAINRERIKRTALAALVPSRPALTTYRDLSSDGWAGDRSQEAIRNQLQALIGNQSDDGVNTSAAPAPTITNPQTLYPAGKSWGIETSGGGGVAALGAPGFFSGDPYLLLPNLPVSWRFTLADLSKAGDGASAPIFELANTLGKNWQIGLTGQTQYIRRANQVGYRSSLTLFIGNEDEPKNLYGSNTNFGQTNTNNKEDPKAKVKVQKQISYRTGGGGVFGKGGFTFYVGPIPVQLRQFQIGWESSARFEEKSQIVNRDALAVSTVIRIGFQFGAEARLKLGLIAPHLDDFSLLQARLGLTATFNIRNYLTKRTVSYPIGEPTRVLQYSTDQSSARLAFQLLGGPIGENNARGIFTSLYFLNAGLQVVGNPVYKSITAAKSGIGGGLLSGATSIAASLPWAMGAIEGLGDYIAGTTSNPLEWYLTLGADVQLRASVDLLNRSLGAGLLAGFGVELGGGENNSGGAFIFIFRTSASVFATIAGLDITLARVSYTQVYNSQSGWNATNPQALIADDRGLVKFLGYDAVANPVVMTASGLNDSLRNSSSWITSRFGGINNDQLVRDNKTSGRLIRMVLAIPKDLETSQLNPDGSVKNLRLHVKAAGKVSAWVDSRNFGTSPVPVDAAEPWAAIINDGTITTASRAVSSTSFVGVKPGDEILLYINNVIDSVPADGASPALQLGLLVGDNDTYIQGADFAYKETTNSPVITDRIGSTYVLSTQDIPLPPNKGDTPPYLAGLVLTTSGSGYHGTFDFIVETSARQASLARAIVDSSKGGIVQSITLMTPGLTQAGDFPDQAALRSKLQQLLTGANAAPFSARLSTESGGSDAKVTISSSAQGVLTGVTIAQDATGSGYLAGESGTIFQQIKDGNRSLILRVLINSGRATTAVVVSSHGTFTNGEVLNLNNDASGGGTGAQLAPVVRDWLLLDQIDQQNIAIGNDQRFTNGGTMQRSSWLTYTQSAPLGKENVPIKEQGVAIHQPVRIARWMDNDNNWQVGATIKSLDDPNTSVKELTPGIDGYNIDPVIAELKGASNDSRDQVLVFSHSDTSAINDTDDLYLLNKVLVKSDLYYSYRIGAQALTEFSSPLKVPTTLPVGQAIGITNNRPYLTSFANTGGGKIRSQVQDLPPNVLLAWLTSQTSESFDADVDIAVSIGSFANGAFNWGNTSLLDPGEGVSSDDLFNLSLTYLDGTPTLSWSVATQQPYLSQILQEKPLQLLRLDELGDTTEFTTLGEQSGIAGERYALSNLSKASSPFSTIQLDTTANGKLLSRDIGALWQDSLGKGDPNQAMGFQGGEFVLLGNPLASTALLNANKPPVGYSAELWIKPQADQNGSLINGSILDTGLYNPGAVLPGVGEIKTSLEIVRTPSRTGNTLGYTYSLRVPANKTISIPEAAKGSGLSPFNLAYGLAKGTALTATFAGSTTPVEITLDEAVLLNGALSYQTSAGSLNNLYSDSLSVEVFSIFKEDSSVTASAVDQAVDSPAVSIPNLPLTFEQVKGWSLRQLDGKLVYNYGEDANGQPLSISSGAIKAGEWNHVLLSYGLVDERQGTTAKKASLAINGSLIAEQLDPGTSITQGDTTVLDYLGYDFNKIEWQLGYGYRGDIDEVAIYEAAPQGFEKAARERINSRFTNPNSASEATFFSTGSVNQNGNWLWAEPEKFTYSQYLGATEPTSNRRAQGEQVIDLVGTHPTRLRADGFPDAALSDRLMVGADSDKLNPGSRITGIRIESVDGTFALGSGKKWKLDASDKVVDASSEPIVGPVAVVANNTPNNALLNSSQNPTELDLAVLASNLDLRLFYASGSDLSNSAGKTPANYQNPKVTYFFQTPSQQLNPTLAPSAVKSEIGKSSLALIQNPSTGVIERGSSFYDYKLIAKAIVVKNAPTNLSDLNSGFQIPFSRNTDGQNSYASQIEVGILPVNGANQKFAAILSSNPNRDAAGTTKSSSIVLIKLASNTAEEQQAYRKLEASKTDLASKTKPTLDEAGIEGLVLLTPAGDETSIGSTIQFADLTGDGISDLIIGRPSAVGGNGEIWVIQGTYLQNLVNGSKSFQLPTTKAELDELQGSVRRIRLDDLKGANPALDPSSAEFGSSLAIGQLTKEAGKSLIIGAPGQITNTTTKSRQGAVWAIAGSAIFTGQPAELANGEGYVQAGGRILTAPAVTEPSVDPTDLQFGSSLSFAKGFGTDGTQEVLLVGLPGLQSTYQLTNGGHTALNPDQREFYLKGIQTTARDTNPPATERVTVESGGILVLDQSNSKRVLIVGQTFGGDAARAGEAIASGGSFDGDTVEDLLIGLPEVDNGTGAAALLKGSELKKWLDEAAAQHDPTDPTKILTKNLAGNIHLYVHGQKPSERFGRVLRLNGNIIDKSLDNTKELVIGNPAADGNTGEIHVITGQSDDNLSVSNANTKIGSINFYSLDLQDPKGRLTLTPGRSLAGFGSAVALADINSGEIAGGTNDDLIMASSTGGSTLTVLYGKQNLTERDRLDLRNIASGLGLEYDGTGIVNNLTGSAVGDFNADGYADLLRGTGVTSLFMAYGASTEAGATHPDAGSGGVAVLDFAAQLNILHNNEIQAGKQSTLSPQIRSTTTVGDLDGDGSPELLITSNYRDRLYEGDMLRANESLVSANGMYTLSMQEDGNLVLYTTIRDVYTVRKVLFSLDSGNLQGVAGVLATGLKPDSKIAIQNGRMLYIPSPTLGNYVTSVIEPSSGYNREKDTLGNRETVVGRYADLDKNDQFKFLILQDDGNLVGYSKGGDVVFALQPAPTAIATMAAPGIGINQTDPSKALLWQQSILFSDAANSNARLASGQVLESIDTSMLGRGGVLKEGDSLAPGEYILSANGLFMAVMQNDGNFVVQTRTKTGGWDIGFALNDYVSGDFETGDSPKVNTLDPSIKLGTTPGTRLTITGGRLIFSHPNFITQQDSSTNYTIEPGVFWRSNKDYYTVKSNALPTGTTFSELRIGDDGILYGKASDGTEVFKVESLYTPEVTSQPITSDLLQDLTLKGTQSYPSAPNYIGTIWSAGEQVPLFASASSGTSLTIQLLLPNQNYREQFTKLSTYLTEWWDSRIGTNVKLDERSRIINLLISASDSASLDERFETALANIQVITDELNQLTFTSKRGTDFEQYVASKAQQYALVSKIINNPIADKSLPVTFSLADLDGDGRKELYGRSGNGLMVFTIDETQLDSLALSGTGSINPRLISLSPEITFGTTSFSGASSGFISDVTGDGRDEIVSEQLVTEVAVSKKYLWAHTATIRDQEESLSFDEFGWRLDPGTLDPSVDQVINVGDINGDGISDFVSDDRTGTIKIGYGRSFHIKNQNLGANYLLTSISYDLTDKINGIRSAGDANGDGLSDIAINFESGKCVIVFGGDFTTSMTLNSAKGFASNVSDGSSALKPGRDVTGATLLLQSITQTGTIGADSLHGIPAGDSIIAREGDDLIIGNGGPDVLNGGPGNDIFIVSDEQFKRLDGGSGSDTLFLNASRGSEWDLTKLASAGRIANMETIDITDYGKNSLSLNTHALLAITDSRRQLLIQADPLKRTPLQQLAHRLESLGSSYLSAFNEFLAKSGISDASFRRLHDGKELINLIDPLNEILVNFWTDYNANLGNKPAFTEAQRNALQVLTVKSGQQALIDPNSTYDTIYLSSDFVLDGDFVLGSERLWSYSTLNSNGTVLISGAVPVILDSTLPTGLVATPWTTPSIQTPGTAQLLPSTPQASTAEAEPLSEQALGQANSAQVLISQGSPEDLRFTVDSPVVQQDAEQIRFTIHRYGYLKEISRLDFRLLGTTADLVPNSYGQVVFVPGQTLATLEIPLIQLDPQQNAGLLPQTPISVELRPQPADHPGPRVTASYAVNGLNGTSEAVAHLFQSLPFNFTNPAALYRRGLGLVMDAGLSSRERGVVPPAGQRAQWINVGLSSLQGPGANDVYFRTHQGEYISLYDPRIQGDITFLSDDIADTNTAAIFCAVRDGGLIDLDHADNGAVEFTILPVLTSPGPVLLNEQVLRAPTRGDSDLWLELSGISTGLQNGQLLLVPTLGADASIDDGNNGTIHPGSATYLNALETWITSKPQGLQTILLKPGPTSLSQALKLQPDTDYLPVLRKSDGTLDIPDLSSNSGLEQRSHASYSLQASEGLKLTLQLSSNRWAMPGLASQESLLQATYDPGSSATSATGALEIALVRCDGLSGAFDLNLNTEAPTEILPGSAGYLDSLARRMREPDGMAVLSGSNNRVPLTFHAGDAIIPLVFQGISSSDWLLLPTEQRSLQGTRNGQPWKVWFDGRDGSTRILQRTGLHNWTLPTTGASFQISANLRTSTGTRFSSDPTRRDLTRFDQTRIALLGFDTDTQISNAQFVYKVDPPSLPTSSVQAPVSPMITTVFDSAQLASDLWTNTDGFAPGMAPVLLDLDGATPQAKGFDPITRYGTRYYNTNGKRYDTVTVSGGSQNQDNQTTANQVTLALRDYAPVLLSTSPTSPIVELADQESKLLNIPYNADLQITLKTENLKDLTRLSAVEYFLVPANSPDIDLNNITKEQIQASGLKLFDTTKGWEQYLSSDSSLLTNSLQLPIGTNFALAALSDGETKAKTLLPTQAAAGQQGQLSFKGISDAVGITIQLNEQGAGLAEFIGRDQTVTRGLNTIGLDKAQSFELQLSREALFSSSFGLYKAIDPQGGVWDTITGQSLLYPGDSGYTEAAVSPRNTGNLPKGLTTPDRTANTTRFEVQSDNQGYLFPYAITNGITYVPFAKANPDKAEHFLQSGMNIFAYEDTTIQKADRDFDDFIIYIKPAI